MHAFRDAKIVTHYFAIDVQMKDTITFLCLFVQLIVLDAEVLTLKVLVEFGTR